MITAKTIKINYKRIIIYLLALAVLIAVLVPQFDQFLKGLDIVKQAEWRWLVIALGFLVLTYLMSAIIYVLLAKKPLKLATTFLVQIATSFTNRIVPAGLGGLGLNADYLMKNKHSMIASGMVVAVNSLVALLSYASLIIIAILAGGTTISQLVKSNNIPLWLIAGGLLVVIAGIITAYNNKKLRLKIRGSLNEAISNLKSYKNNPKKLFFAYLGAGMITVFYVATLYTCAQAVGLNITILQAFIGYTLGVVLGAAVLTPGGLGGVEAGLYGAFVAYGYEPSLAFAAVITYRLLTYWLPILPGLFSFLCLRRLKKI